MKFTLKSFCFLLLFLFSLLTGKYKVSAQTFTVDTILYNGNSNNYIDLVFMGDGFQAGQLSSYINSVQNLSNYLFTISPFSEYKNYFNVFAIRVPSLNSGTNHPAIALDVTEPVFPAASVNTYFNSTFDYGSIHRLLVAQDYTAINNVLINNMPLVDQPLMLVNSTYYGGSGGALAASSLNSSSYEILVHEIGHSFAFLKDEYF
ncbi:MAG TPA: M64 family metallopeptidase, partial [Bacteroidia bacterium]|nr:M64 family metallopeptidase [Bacteroidia bacterium]